MSEIPNLHNSPPLYITGLVADSTTGKAHMPMDDQNSEHSSITFVIAAQVSGPFQTSIEFTMDPSNIVREAIKNGTESSLRWFTWPFGIVNNSDPRSLIGKIIAFRVVSNLNDLIYFAVGGI